DVGDRDAEVVGTDDAHRRRFAESTSFTAPTTASAVSPCVRATYSLEPNEQNSSFTPTARTGTAAPSRASTSETQEKSPPMTEWFSAVTSAPVRSASAATAAPSTGLI